MNILAIETTSPAASVALIDGSRQVLMERSDEKLSHLQNLMPMIDRILKTRQMQIGDINCIAVSEGPGSFTGIRIGMAAAKGLAQVLDIGIIPVPTLKAMVLSMPGHEGILCPMLDARRGQVYGGAYIWKEKENGRRECVEIVPGGAYMEQELRAMAEAARAERDIAAETAYLGDECQLASNVAQLAFESYKNGAVKNLFEIHPVYMRKAEAERKLEEKLRQEQERK